MHPETTETTDVEPVAREQSDLVPRIEERAADPEFRALLDAIEQKHKATLDELADR